MGCPTLRAIATSFQGRLTTQVKEWLPFVDRLVVYFPQFSATLVLGDKDLRCGVSVPPLPCMGRGREVCVREYV